MNNNYRKLIWNTAYQVSVCAENADFGMPKSVANDLSIIFMFKT